MCSVLHVFLIIYHQCLREVSCCAFLGGGGGSGKDGHEFPFLRDVELVERSLKAAVKEFHVLCQNARTFLAVFRDKKPTK